MERQIRTQRGTWRLLLGLAILLSIQASALSATRYVPSRDYRTIQSAINAAANGDVIVVAPGTYTGLGNVNLDFKGKAITVRSQINPANPDWNIIAATVIDCGGEPPSPIPGAEDPNRAANRAFWFHTSEGPNSKVLGFTIRNGYARGPKGRDGRFGIDPPAPRISVDPADPNGPPQAENGRNPPGSGISLNGYGGAILCGHPDNTSVSVSPTIQYCVITNCIVTGAHGGNGAAGQSGVWSYQPPYDVNDPNAVPPAVVTVNDGQWGGDAGNGFGNGCGGAIACLGGSSPLISDCIIKDNFAHGGCGGDGGAGGNAVSNPANASPPNYSGGNESFGGNAGIGFGDGIGGGIYAENGSSPIITNCVFDNDIATTGIRAAGGPAGQGTTIPDADGGPATDGLDGFVLSSGGIAGGAAYYSHPSTANFTNCTFTGNKAYEAYIYYNPLYILGEDISAYTVGGAVYSDISNNITINTCDFKNNMGGAIYCASGCTLIINNAYDPNHNCLFITNADPNDGSDLYVDSGVDFGSGGAIYVDSGGSANIQNCIFTSNLAKNDGGALECRSNLVLKNCSFGGNTARNGYGGATDVYKPGATTPLTIDANNCSFSGNQAVSGGGFSSDNFTATFANCYFIGNTARESGGLDLWYGNITFSNGIIKNNIATNGYGGGLNCHSTSAQILHSTIMDNLAAGSSPTGGCGGGINFEGSASPQRVFNCLITGNSATVNGGAIYCFTATPEIKNCTFDNDFAGGFGGAIFSNWSSQPQIINCIFRKCNGHAIHEEDNGGDASATYCLFYNNSGGEYYDSGTRLVYMGAGQVGSIPGGSNNLYGDPLFVSGDLGSYYLSQTSAGQSSNSPALNKGSGTSIILGLNTYTTATNNMGDVGLVDIGYHYRRSIGVATFHLTASVVGGHGTVAPTSGTYYAGTIVTLTAKPNTGWMVKSWSGTDDDTSTDVNNSVVMYADRTITVQFRQPRTLIVSAGGGQQGYYSDIQDAVLDANDGDTIIVYPGIYYGAYLAQILIVDRSVLITSVNPNDPCCVAATIIDGFMGHPLNEGYNNTGVWFTAGADNKTVLNGFTIQNCGGGYGDGLNGDRGQNRPNGGDGGCGEGPAIFTYPGAAPVIKNCVIRNNVVFGGDGGDGVNATNNQNAGRGGWSGWAHGGAVYCGPFSSPIFINCQIIDNQAVGGNGGDGGDYQANGGIGNYGGTWSRAGSMDSPAYDIDPTNLNMMPIIDGTQLWALWDWDQAISYWPMFGDANRTSYFGNYRWYSGYGGGAYCDIGSDVTFIDCLISRNLAQGGMSGQGGIISAGTRNWEPLIPYEIPSFGGGVYCAADAVVTFTGCTIMGNVSSPPVLVDPADPNSGLRFHLDPYLGHGGGVCAEDTATVLFDNCTFSGNQSSVGGGLNWADANPDINDCNFTSNSAYHGGGLFGEHGPATIRGCNIANNEAVPDTALDEEILGAGGGVHCWAAEVNLIDCNISSNMAEYSGGGVYLGGESAPSLFNCLVTDNSAGSAGGGVSVEWYSDCSIVNCTIVGNTTSSYGGGLYCSYNSNVNIINSIIWNNIGPNGAQVAVAGGYKYDPRPSALNITYSDIGPRYDPNTFTVPIIDDSFDTGSTQGGLTTALVDSQNIYGQFDAGQERVKVIVSMPEPVELKAMTRWNSPESIARFRVEVNDRQSTVLSMLRPGEFTLRYRYGNVAAFSGEITRAGLEKLISDPKVAHIEPVRQVRPMLRQAIPLANALNARAVYNGTGVAIAIVDSGIDYRHPMLGGGGFPNSKVIGGYDTGSNDGDPMPGVQPHGTACAGIAAGNLGNVGDYIGGVAPGAKLYALKVTTDEDVWPTDSELAAWDWCITHRNDNPQNPIKVISNSWGIYGMPFNDPRAADAYSPAHTALVETAVAAGITVLAASGNDGYAGQGIAWPAAMSKVISVGAVYDTTDIVTGYSDTANILDILAPADPIYTTDIVGAGGYTIGNYEPNFNGTSAACPFAAGCVADIQSAARAKLGRYLTPAEVKSLLVVTGDPVTDIKVAITKPRVNLGNAIAGLEMSPIYIEKGCELNGWQAPDTNSYWGWDPNLWLDSHNIEEDPCFIAGYCLSQFAAGQIVESNCVDGGSDLASVFGLDRYTTRTDSGLDANIVDMGYHYRPFTPHQYMLTFTAVNQPGWPVLTIVEPTPSEPNFYEGLRNWYTTVHLRVSDTYNPADYQVHWTGTDDDSKTGPNNTVTIVDADKVVTARLVKTRYNLTIRVDGGNGRLSAGWVEGTTSYAIQDPCTHSVKFGTVVQLTAEPVEGQRVRKWTGTDNDTSRARTNTVTMNLNEDRTVSVKFGPPVFINVPGDYTNIQMAINAANDGDVVVIAPGIYDITDSSPPLETEYLLISGKSFTITSVNPDDPCVVAATVIQDGGLVIENVTRDMVIDGITIRGAYYSGNDNWHLTFLGYISGFKAYGVNAKWATPTGSGNDGPGGHMGDTYGGGIELRDNLLNSFPPMPCVTSPTIRNCIIIDCSANGIHGGNGNGGGDALGWGGNGGWGGAGCGGGAYIGANNSPIFTNCTFVDCWARGGDGGGGGDNPNGHGGSWGDPNALWWWEYGPFEDEWKYSGYGGAVYCAANSSPEFVDCNFANNYSYGGSCGISGGGGQVIGWPYEHYRIDRFGGAVYCAASSSPVFTGCNFVNNEADVNGPQFWNADRNEQSANVNSYDTYLSYGGAIAFEDDATPTFDKCTFSGNLAAIGGGMWTTWAEPNIVDCNFIQNIAFHGGGVYFVGSDTIKITNSNFSENEALYDTSIIAPNNPEDVLGEGGAIYCFDVNAAIADCNVFNNTAGYSGGGIYISGSSMSLVKNCLITDNFAGRDGGGVSVDWYSDANIVNCTIANNRVAGEGYGGGLYCSYNSYANVLNSIIWNNTGGIGAKGTQLAVGTGFKYGPRPSTVNVTYSDIQNATEPNAFAGKAEAIDLVFCIDSTGSMWDDIDAVKVAINQITSAVAAKIPDFRIAVVDFKDFNQADYGLTTDYPYRTVVSFTTNTNLIVAAINSITAPPGAGNDTPEAVYAALMHCLNHSLLAQRLGGQLYGASALSLGPGAWRPGNVLRVIILMGDAQPHDPEPFTGYTLDDITAAATSGAEPKHIMSVVIGQDPNAVGYFRSLANETGGAALQAAGAGQVVQAIMNAIDLVSRIPDPVFVDTGCTLNWNPNTYTWSPGSHNIDEDPLFIAGYCLSQFAAGQVAESNCVDGGSDLASVFGLDRYTTRVDSVMDAGIVDMGYHYRPFTPHQYILTFKAVNQPGWPVLTIVEPTPSEPNFYEGLHDWYTTVHLRVSGTYNPADYQVHWTGTDNDNSDQSTNTVTMDNDKQVSVRLVKTRYNLTIGVDGGNGRLSARWVEGSSSYTIKDPCTHSIKFGTVVQLTAEPIEGYRVRRWSGTDNDTSRAFNNTVTMNLDSDRTVSVELGPPVTVTVPGDYPTIWDAISVVQEGDTVVVEPGTYYGGYDAVMVVVDKSVVIRSRNPDDPCCVAQTIIDGYLGYQLGQGYNNIGIVFTAAADANTVLNGFTIQNCGGYWGDSLDGDREAGHPDGYDGGCGEGAAIIIMPGASPTIKNCVIRNNVVQAGNAGNGVAATDALNAGRGGWGGWARGGAIYCSPDTNVKFINCQIIDNQAQGGNGGNGGNFQANGGAANYGGNWSINRGYNIPPTGAPVYVEGNLWAVWQWDLAISYWPLYEEPTRTSYFGDYRWYSGYGGGVYCDVNSIVSFEDCLISGNTTQGGMSGQGGVRNAAGRQQEPLVPYEIPSYGGGVYCAAGASVTFTGCTIANNISSPPQYVVAGDPTSGLRHRLDPYVGHGGGVCAENTASVEFNACTLSENEASIGAGTFWVDANSIATDCNILGNEAFTGGGIYLVGGSSKIVSSDLRANTASGPIGAGGGVYCFDANVLVTDCNIAHNDANSSGGGIYFGGNNTLLVKNCLILNNSAGRDGGGASVNWYANAVLANCTFAGNATPGTFGQVGNTGMGGGLYTSYESDTTVKDSIFWNNFALKGSEMGVGTGFEYDKRPAKLTVSYSDVKGGQYGIYVDTGCVLNWGAGNIDSNPLFVTGMFGDYYLSQTAVGDPNQTENSPCVDVGSDYTGNVGLIRRIDPAGRIVAYTTRTDGELDHGKVDMGYHYRTVEPCRFCDLVYDGIINFQDYAVIAAHWLQSGCSDLNGWCGGADVTFNGIVNSEDSEFLMAECWLVEDTRAPIPNPSEWEIEPYLASSTSVKMTAKTAFDEWGWDVQYYFDCVYGNGHDSGWQASRAYQDTGLPKDAIYGYRVRARDELGNQTEWSVIRYAGVLDTIPPAPAPTWAVAPYATGPASVAMEATVAYDDSGVNYGFWNVTRDPAGNNIVWQTGTQFVDVNLDPNTTYGYRVKARDGSLKQNETAWSVVAYATTFGAVDITPPTPNPAQWDLTVDANGYNGRPRKVNIGGGPSDYYATMTAVQAADPSGVEYRFVCANDSRFSSGWQSQPAFATPWTYTVQLGGVYVYTEWYVIVRDQSPNYNQTTKSETWPALERNPP